MGKKNLPPHLQSLHCLPSMWPTESFTKNTAGLTSTNMPSTVACGLQLPFSWTAIIAIGCITHRLSQVGLMEDGKGIFLQSESLRTPIALFNFSSIHWTGKRFAFQNKTVISGRLSVSHRMLSKVTIWPVMVNLSRKDL